MVRIALRWLPSTVILLCSISTTCIAQTRALQVQLDSKAEHISVAIDFLSTIKKAVVQSRKGKEHATYKALGIRFGQCAVLYGIFSKNPSLDPAALAEFGNSSAVLNLASGFIYPDGIENYKRDVTQANAEILKMVEVKDERKIFYTLRSCKDFWDPQLSTVINAIIELTLP